MPPSSANRSNAANSNRASTSYSTRINTRVVLALSEGRGSLTEVGMAWIDLDSNECVVCQLSDIQSYAKTIQKLVIVQPSEIIVPKTMMEPRPSKLILSIQTAVSDLRFVTAFRKTFSQENGLNFVSTFGVDGGGGASITDDKDATAGKTDAATTSVMTILQDKYFGLSCVGALFEYLSFAHRITFHQHSLLFRYEAAEGTMTIGHQSAKDLELVACLSSTGGGGGGDEGCCNYDSYYGHSKGCLFEVLNFTLTKMGKRRLRAGILQPLTDVATINARQDAVAELISGENRFHALRNVLKTLADIDAIISCLILVVQSETTGLSSIDYLLHQLLNLKHLLGQLETVSAALGDCTSPLLMLIKGALNDPDLARLLQIIDTNVSDDLVPQSSGKFKEQQHLHAIKQEENGLLTIARQTYNEVTDDIHKLVDDYNGEFDFAIKLKYRNNKTHYCLETRDEHVSVALLPSVFINGVKRKKYIEFTSVALTKANTRLYDCALEITILSVQAATLIMEEGRRRMSALYNAADALGMLDLLLSFAYYALTNPNCCRPEFDESSKTLAMRQCTHPIKAAKAGSNFTPNDIYAFEGGNFQIISGPNESGKSTYLKQAALLIVMAQIGCFIPSIYATLYPFTQILTRLSHDDSLTDDLSTFMVETRDMASILRHVHTGKSLVLVDELGRGTSSYDGVSIAFAICEVLLKVSNAVTLFATHFLQLGELLEMYHNVVNLNLGFQNDKFTYTVGPGLTDAFNYGNVCAKHAGFPQSVIEGSIEISRYLKEKQFRSTAVVEKIKDKHSHSAIKVVMHLNQVRKSGKMNDEDMLEYLKNLQVQIRDG